MSQWPRSRMNRSRTLPRPPALHVQHQSLINVRAAPFGPRQYLFQAIQMFEPRRGPPARLWSDKAPAADSATAMASRVQASSSGSVPADAIGPMHNCAARLPAVRSPWRRRGVRSGGSRRRRRRRRQSGSGKPRRAAHGQPLPMPVPQRRRHDESQGLEQTITVVQAAGRQARHGVHSPLRARSSPWPWAGFHPAPDARWNRQRCRRRPLNTSCRPAQAMVQIRILKSALPSAPT